MELDAIRRYLAGASSPSEADAVRAWMATDPDAAAFVEALRSIVQPVQPASAQDWKTDAGWRQLVADAPGLAQPPRGGRHFALVPRRSAIRAGAWAVAAGALVAVAVVSSVIARGGRSARLYATATGERKAVTLMDGTRVTLAPASRIELPADYGKAGREMSLDGEALFEVVHDAAHPFRVRSGQVVTEDIGTRFAIRAWDNEATVQVAVVEGAVGVGAGHDRPLLGVGRPLAPGDIATIADTAVAIAHHADVDAAVAFASGKLVFSDEPLHEALVDVARWYGVAVTLSDPAAADRPVRGSFDAASLSVVLDAIAGQAGVRWTRAGDAIAVVANGH
jgi:transmembrane sensor